jgi:hypothetical protein
VPSPVATVEFCQIEVSGAVLDKTTFGVSFIHCASGPVAVGQ